MEAALAWEDAGGSGSGSVNNEEKRATRAKEKSKGE
jgi:hypothetical protein